MAPCKVSTDWLGEQPVLNSPGQLTRIYIGRHYLKRKRDNGDRMLEDGDYVFASLKKTAWNVDPIGANRSKVLITWDWVNQELSSNDTTAPTPCDEPCGAALPTVPVEKEDDKQDAGTVSGTDSGSDSDPNSDIETTKASARRVAPEPVMLTGAQRFCDENGAPIALQIRGELTRDGLLFLGSEIAEKLCHVEPAQFRRSIVRSASFLEDEDYQLDTVLKLYDSWQAQFGGGYESLVTRNQALEGQLIAKQNESELLLRSHDREIEFLRREAAQSAELSAAKLRAHELEINFLKELNAEKLRAREQEIEFLRREAKQTAELHQLRLEAARRRDRDA
ncbi:hypothetical protein HDU86_000643 [Geranomyces michiganensis]|nr:hypothetical protein HDU86_000643 [Geranomyces michiganensis]